MRKLYLGSGDKQFKFADTETEIHLNAFDGDSSATLTADAKVKIKNDSGYLLGISASITNNHAVITSGQLAQLPVGSYLIELWNTVDGGTAIYPSDGFLALQINENVTGLSGGLVSSITVDDFIKQFSDLSQQLKQEVSEAVSNGLKGDTGADGVAGKDGVGLSSTTVTYQVSTSGTTEPTGSWSSSVPTVAKGEYLWTKTVWNYSDGTNETGYSVAYVGTDGTDGTDGVGISSTTVTYQLSTSGTTEPTGSWSDTVLSPTTANPYLWTKTLLTYSDNSIKTLYTISVKGDKGDKGDTGSVDNTGLTAAPAFVGLQTQVNNSAVGTNLLLGTSRTLNTAANASGWNSGIPIYYLSNVTTVNSDTFYTVNVWISPSSHDMQTQVSWKDASGILRFGRGNVISAGTSGYSTWTGTVTAGSTIQSVTIVFTAQQSTPSSVSYKEVKLERGSHDTDWCLNPTEILTQADYAKIQAAIVALGGSLK